MVTLLVTFFANTLATPFTVVPALPAIWTKSSGSTLRSLVMAIWLRHHSPVMAKLPLLTETCTFPAADTGAGPAPSRSVPAVATMPSLTIGVRMRRLQRCAGERPGKRRSPPEVIYMQAQTR